MPDLRRRKTLIWGISLLAPTLTTMTNTVLAATPAAPQELRSTLPAAHLLGSGPMRFFDCGFTRRACGRCRTSSQHSMHASLSRWN